VYHACAWYGGSVVAVMTALEELISFPKVIIDERHFHLLNCSSPMHERPSFDCPGFGPDFASHVFNDQLEEKGFFKCVMV